MAGLHDGFDIGNVEESVGYGNDWDIFAYLMEPRLYHLLLWFEDEMGG